MKPVVLLAKHMSGFSPEKLFLCKKVSAKAIYLIDYSICTLAM